MHVVMMDIQVCCLVQQNIYETRNFDGQAVVIFQPAEGGGGGLEMCKDGLMEISKSTK